MCAIAGIIDYSNRLEKTGTEIKEQMLKTMSNRGPDQNGIFECENALLLHARLSVIDPENGIQPMKAKYNGTEYTIVYNGEIYNCNEIKNELSRKGVYMETECDTEVVLKAFIVFGEQCVEKFNGIFAFAIWNKDKKELFLARDKMGVKPLFYTMCKGQFIFASEIKTILCHPDVTPQIDLNSVSELILIGPGRTPGYGVFRGIKEIMPGECATFGRDGLNVKKYWNLRDKVHTDSPDETAQNIRFLVKDAVERQLVSDVPLGTFLSGGLDSSIISSVAAKYFKERGKQLTTFSVYYKDNDKYFSKSKFQPDSDTKYIDIMCDYLGCDHKSIVIDTPALVEALYNAVDARDLPGMADVDSSLLLFCKEVKKHCTVALSGECADEIFGGYPWYRDKSITRKKGFPWAQTTDWRNSFLLPDISKNISAEEYVMNKYQTTADQSDIIDAGNEDDKHHKIMMNLNINWFMQTLLDRKDRMSMYSGLEVRVPFCDWRICDYLYSVPFEMKEYGGYEKGLLRKAVTGLLPDEILWRKKSPYPKTHNPEYLNMVSNILKEIISDPNQPIFNIIDRNQLAKLPDNSSSTPWYGQLMTIPQTIAYFIQLNYWMNKFKPEIIL